MTQNEILTKIKAIQNGRYMTITKSKDYGNGVSKVSRINVRKGVAYANMACNKDKITGSLPWGAWLKGYENIVVEHKGQMYLRVSAVDSEGVKTLDTKYYNNGVEIDKATATALVGEKKMTSNASQVYNIKFENILDIVG